MGFDERGKMKNCRWLKPELNDGSSTVQKFKALLIPILNLGQIEFAEWTRDGHLRHSKFVGLRDDKDARSVTREE
jgi:ATP-dependent DNA ligase